MSKDHIWKSGIYFIYREQCVWLRLKLYLLHNDSAGNDNAVFAVIMENRVVLHLALECAVCIVCTAAQRANTQSSWLRVHVGEHCDCYNAIEAVLLTLLAIAMNTDGPSRSSWIESKEKEIFEKETAEMKKGNKEIWNTGRENEWESKRPLEQRCVEVERRWAEKSLRQELVRGKCRQRNR